eukprot:CAMPEP_0202363326 /NCGR_PEP_ID=MMETSP1126-20121109/15169_1 /ASSEMBLY_ACC=CAM_ASM_000457 /TAXON_ID=3047 /ORGANISM="Dunaliella tertiolecta, Strain CCMP1320" /LENGTH=109 /DNA_ID=CAMNT_0048957727 /DNA_START=144 /DNA_END=473 /DNA_ORIENTATION=-
MVSNEAGRVPYFSNVELILALLAFGLDSCTIFVPGRELLMKVTFVEVSTTEIPSIASAASQGETGFVKIIPDMSFLWGALISVKPKFKAHASSHERAPVRSAFMVYFSK